MTPDPPAGHRQDFRPITEVPGSLLNRDQTARFAHRYLYGAALGRGKRVLEVACGAGSGASLIHAQAAAYVGLDYTFALLHDLRRQMGPGLPLVQADAQRLPVAGATFDLILCFEAIYYLADYRAFLQECRRVLAAQGRVLIVQSNPDWVDFVPGALSRRYPPGPELATALAACGFTQIELWGALPTPQTGPRQHLVNQLRRVLHGPVRGGLGKLLSTPGAEQATAQIKRVLYGELAPLPTQLGPDAAHRAAAGFTLTSLAPTQIDRGHRVHYVLAMTPGEAKL